MMQKLERRVCECCGQSDFTQLDSTHIKCSYCDTVYFAFSGNNSISEQDYHNWWQKNYEEACERRDQELALEKTRHEAYEREQFNKNMEKALKLKKQCTTRVRISIILNILMMIGCINSSIETNNPIFTLFFVIFFILMFVRVKMIEKRKEFVWAKQFCMRNL